MATALREMGRIEKTIFILDYISSEAMRRRIHRRLNKGEAMNALASGNILTSWASISLIRGKLQR
ncbi:Tn3 family transposase [Desulfosporosinus sp. OT]|uniref:Tn3 family transposase n=1 Tax=Desulfosporosinus sp. OT TaxID=913865 RepID=UPI0002239CDD|nr:Tn3 family transposase [Desulfosporosinus sp. OT]EGW39336.1 DNA polymerase III, beta subunit [Desulfosporosinus sp. OT]